MDGRTRPNSAHEGFEQELIDRIHAAVVDFSREFPNALTGEQPVERAKEGYVLDVRVRSDDPQKFAVMNGRLGSLLRKRGLSGF